MCVCTCGFELSPLRKLSREDQMKGGFWCSLLVLLRGNFVMNALLVVATKRFLFSVCLLLVGGLMCIYSVTSTGKVPSGAGIGEGEEGEAATVPKWRQLAEDLVDRASQYMSVVRCVAKSELLLPVICLLSS